MSPTAAATHEVLEGTVVVDLAGTVATAYCGKLLRELGARVINVEPGEGGHPIRNLPPLRPSAPLAEASGLAAYLSAGKESVVLPGDAAARRAALGRLCRRADVVLCADDPSVPTETLVADAVVTSITWFGHHGPYAGYRGNEAVIASLVGLVRGIGPAEGPPLLPAGHQCQLVAGTTAFVATVVHLLAQLLGNTPSGDSTARTLIEVSVLEAALCIVEPGPVNAHNLGEVLPRLGVNRFWPTYPAAIYPCRNGWIGITALTPKQWRTLCELVGLPALGTDPRYQTALERLAAADELDLQLAPRLLERTAAEWFHAGQEARLPLAMVPTMAELLATAQFVERQAFTAIEHPDLGRFQAPASPFRLQRTPLRSGGRAPRLGEHTDTVLDELHQSIGSEPADPPQRSLGVARWSDRNDYGAAAAPPTCRPTLLRGVRIVDLTMGWAGPLATRHLADMGAEVIKVESCQYFDWWRGWEVTPEMIEERRYERAPSFLTVNRNKLAITLDLTRSEGASLLRRLVSIADAVVENYTASVLPRLGLDYEQLRDVNPELVMLAMPPFGASGAWKNYRAYGSTVEHASGLPHLQGAGDWPPTMQHVALGDPIAGVTGAAALLTALMHKRRTGEGQLIDLSHVEALFPFVAHGLIAQSLNAASPLRLGSRHPRHAPQGVYPCRGEQRWLAISIENDRQWRALCELAGPELSDPRFATEAQRKENEDDIDRRLADFTRREERDALMNELQRRGIPAGSVLDALELLEDPHLHARGFWQWLERDFVGRQPNPSPPYRFTPTAPAVETAAPTLGQHNRQVLGELLGLSAAEIDALERDGIVGTEPVVP